MATNVAAGDVGSGLLTLVASTVETVNFSEDLDSVEVVHVSGTDVVWYTLDGSTPVVGGSRSYVLPPGSVDTREPKTNNSTVVKLLSTGVPVVRVQRAD